MISPPPIVSLGEGRRTMNRSCFRTASGARKRNWTQAVVAGLNPLAVEQGDARRELGGAGEEIDLVVLLQRDRGIGQEAQARVEALTRGHQPGRSQHVSARTIFSSVMPERLTAVRRPGSARRDLLLVALQTSHPRPGDRADRDAARRRRRCSPPLRVPVTTVPKPATEKTRSIGKRGAHGASACQAIAASTVLERVEECRQALRR